ncbi:MAG: NUDIX hydrolase [Actinobacteria bacterium]|nr:NUDIX hydrolase [Actinomycetota bacterium]
MDHRSDDAFAGVASKRWHRSGDGFLRCDDGHVRWGRFGAAGALFVVRGERGTEALVQLRSARAHEGGTWSCPGGAMNRGESPLVAALRETAEEVGTPPGGFEVLGDHVFAPAGDWRYVTSVIEVAHRFGVAANFESTEIRWCTAEEIDALPLHPGFAAAWPHLRAIAKP